MTKRCLTWLCIGMLTCVCSMTEAYACLGPYRSPEEVVASSELIFIGTVKSVTMLPIQEKNPESMGYKTSPSEATVEIRRILSGSTDRKTLTTSSGPVESCSWDPVYYLFTEGETSIFLLSDITADGKATLDVSGRMRDLGDLELIESTINRAKVYKAAYLDHIRASSPKVYAAAEALSAKLIAESKQWPDKPAYEKEPNETDAQHKEKRNRYDAAVTALVTSLRAIDAPVLRTAIAMNWFTQGPKPFTQHPLWRDVKNRMRHDKQFWTSERAELRRILQQAGIAEKDIKAYLAAIPDKALDTGITFPICAPSPWNQDEKPGDILTTDFILRYHCFDRGGIIRMDFDQFAKIQPERLTEVLPAMYGSQDETVSLVALRAIERMPGTRYYGLLWDKAQRGDRYVLESLIVKDQPDATAQRVHAFLQQTPKHVSAWDVLLHCRFFDDAAIREAIACLNAPKPPDAVYTYLNAAMQQRTVEPVAKRTAQEYEAWFKEHPKQDDWF